MIHVELRITDAIVSLGEIPMGGISDRLTPFCGNQHNPDWRWDRDAVERLSDAEKKELWEMVKPAAVNRWWTTGYKAKVD